MQATTLDIDTIVKQMLELRDLQNTIHVISSGNRWAVFLEGKKKSLRVLDSRPEAIRLAKKTLTHRKEYERIAIHNRMGEVERFYPAIA